MPFPEDLLYTESHEWVRKEENSATVGITDYAQSQLKDIVYVELPQVGSTFKKGDSLGVVESVKTVADLFSPISGKVIEVNGSLKDHPQFVNEDPYGKGWMVRLEILDPKELDTLLSSADYEKRVAEEE
jgi:glycine cleavage system H protein